MQVFTTPVAAPLFDLPRPPVNHDHTVRLESRHKSSPMSLIENLGASEFHAANKALDYDVLIVGAGLSGIFSLYRMLQLGLRVKVIEAGSAEGGTWFW